MTPSCCAAVSQANGILIGTTRQNIGNLPIGVLWVASVTVLTVWAVREHRKGRPQLWVLMGVSVITYFGTDAATRMLTGLQSKPGANGLVIYRAFDIDIAIWMGLVFAPYIGFIGYFTFLAFAEGRPRRTFWLILAVSGPVGMVGEYIMIHPLDLYAYTGKQPLNLFGLPLVWPWVWVSTPMLLGATLALLSRTLHGIRWLLALPLLGSAYLAYASALCWPAMTARAMDVSAPLLSAIGLATLGCMLSTLYVVSLFLPSSHPPPEPRTANQPMPSVRAGTSTAQDVPAAD